MQKNEPISFASFMEQALYDPANGYYVRNRIRVGKEKGTDFYTSSTLSAVFGRLLSAAAAKLLGPNTSHAPAWVEIAAEPGQEVSLPVGHPWAKTQQWHLGETPVLPPLAVVWANEWLDAQPVHRMLWDGYAWTELGVMESGGKFSWHPLPEPTPAVRSILPNLPVPPAAPYHLDLPFASVEVLEPILRQPWRGLLLLLDYGKTWQELVEETPQGTARAYFRHRQVTDLLARPGEQDLTAHICWDWIENSLRKHGFQTIRRLSQEAFFLHFASDEIRRILEEEPNPLAPARRQLQQLLHPAFLGASFQVLSAAR